MGESRMTEKELFKEFERLCDVMSREIEKAGTMRFVYLEKRDATEVLMLISILKAIMDDMGKSPEEQASSVDELLEKVFSESKVNFDEFDNLGPDIEDDVTSADYSEINYDKLREAEKKINLELEGDDHVRQQ